MKTQPEALALANHVTLHAFGNHRSEFGTISRREFQAIVHDAVMKPSAVRTLSNGRTAYWSARKKIVLIENMNAPERSTAFRPTGGRAYFENLQ